MSKSLTINAWGNDLSLRITKPIASVLGLTAGSEVNVALENGRLVVSPKYRRRSLDEMLSKFDINLHGGEFGTGSDGKNQTLPLATCATVRHRIDVSRNDGKQSGAVDA